MTTQWRKLRASEWMLAWYFAYVALLAVCFRGRPNLHQQPLWILAAAALMLLAVARAQAFFPVAISRFRDFLPLGFTLVAFEEMNLFAPRQYDAHFEQAWIRWDHLLLHDWHLRAAIESLGSAIPIYLELCYLLVYGLGTYCLIILYVKHRRPQVDRFFVVTLTGTLIAYGLFPFFPSQPPRLLFHGLDEPAVTSWVRRLNLWILHKASIHVSVFPSAHVSSAFAAAWAMFLLFPDRKRFGWGLLVYAISVSIATIYGRYHYTADVLAGFAISLISAGLCPLLRRRAGTVGE